MIDQWWQANALPPSIATILDQAPEWREAVLIDAFAERCTDLRDGQPRHTQSDLLAIIGLPERLAVLAIEAKVSEGFDKTVGEWRAEASPGKDMRLKKLCRLFDLDPTTVDKIRYQLLHRTAAAILEARRYRSGQAAMIVQSWSPLDEGFADFRAFFERIGLPNLQIDALSPSVLIDGVNFRTGWAHEAISPPS